MMMMLDKINLQQGSGLQNLFSVSFHVKQTCPNKGMTKGRKRSRNIIRMHINMNMFTCIHAGKITIR
jgi:hypothetical protein